MSLLKRIGACFLFLMLLSNGTALAKGPPDKVTISGPGLPDAIEITDTQTLDSFSMGQFIDFEAPIEKPPDQDTGYRITRWYHVGSMTNDANLKAIDTFAYFPNPQGDKGIVFYEGIIDKMFIYGGSPNDGKWFQATEGGELAMRQILAEFDVSVYDRSSQLTFPAGFLKWVGYGSLVLGGLALYVVNRQKQVSGHLAPRDQDAGRLTKRSHG